MLEEQRSGFEELVGAAFPELVGREKRRGEVILSSG